jgi:hypothetical protein
VVFVRGSKLVVLAFLVGCGGSEPSPKTPAKATAVGPAAPSAQQNAAAEAVAQRDAQAAWCGYLEALYLRAAEGATSWPRKDQCTEVTTMASPKMLKRAATCSMEALRTYPGDPFTPEYAAEVSRCGAEALDAIVVTQTDLAPFVATLCGRLTTCGDLDYGECREALTSGLGPQLERSIGAMNTQGRTQLQACLKTVSCEEVGGQIAGCLEPIMDALLWLPG